MSADERRVSERLDVPPVQPVHWQASPNAPIALGSFRASFAGESDSETEIVSGEACLRFTPKELLQLVIPAATEESLADTFSRIFTGISSDSIRLHLRDFDTTFDVFRTSASSARTVFVPKRVPIQVFKPVGSITRAVFHLFNWPDFWGPQNYVLLTGTPPLQGAKSCGRISLDFDGWSFSVAATDQSDQSIKSLDESGGFSITHVGSIQRTDQSPFSTGDLENSLSLLSYFFSFVLGRWSSPCLTVGFDASGERVYEEWGMRRCDEGSWSGAGSWFDAHHSEMFAAALPGFWKLWSSEIWHRPLTEAIYWYVNANRGGSGLGVDSALLFTQAALELLSWTYCVLDRKMVSASAFKPRGLSASDKLRLLASSLGIPVEIPSSLSSLHAKPGKKWDDSMDALTDLRNRLVHPGTDKAIPDGAYYDAWRLSMWYLDLVLLRLCEYHGNYSNRLAQRYVGQVESVPWSPKGDANHGGS